MPEQPWIRNARADSGFILLPPFLAVAVALLIPFLAPEQEDVTLPAWIILVVCIDVAHVYSTLYRTYADATMRRRHSALLVAAPLLAWVAGMLLCFFSYAWFWRVMAYLALFHFIRQQYGFMRIYSRKETGSAPRRRLDAAAIYLAALFPVVYWHFRPGRRFHWFMEGDFFQWDSLAVIVVAGVLYGVVQLLYLAGELYTWYRTGYLNLPKNLVWLGTLLSWSIGIILLNGDLTFTLTNVVTHGIPYMALVWMTGNAGMRRQPMRPALRYVFSLKGLWMFIGLLLVLAYLEEGLWDGLVWREAGHETLFAGWHILPQLSSREALYVLVPLLSMPQVTHYILDAYIWKMRKGDTSWKEQLLSRG